MPCKRTVCKFLSKKKQILDSALSYHTLMVAACYFITSFNYKGICVSLLILYNPWLLLIGIFYYFS